MSNDVSNEGKFKKYLKSEIRKIDLGFFSFSRTEKNNSCRKLALVGKFLIKFSSLSAPTKIEEHSAAPPGIPAGLRCVFSSDPAVVSSIFVGAEREENLNSCRNFHKEVRWRKDFLKRSGELPSVRDERRVRGKKRENSSCTSTDSNVNVNLESA